MAVRLRLLGGMLGRWGWVLAVCAFLPAFGTGHAEPADEPMPAPSVVARSPERGEALPIDGTIELVFDRAMEPRSVEAAFGIDPCTAGIVTWADDRTFRFQPAAPLTRDASYEITLLTAARARDGTPLAVPYAFRLRTVGFLEVTQTLPAHGAEEIASDGTITVIFNRPVVPLVAVSDPAYAALPDPLQFEPDIVGTGEWLNTSIYVYTPSRPLAGGTRYTARVTAGLSNTGGAVLAEAFAWTFATERPKAVWIEPSREADLVPVNASIRVTFNMPVDPASAEGLFRVRTASLLGDLFAESVDGTVDVQGETLTFTPDTWLAFDRRYVAVVDAGITGAEGGVGSETPTEWSFTTVPLPRILSTDPRNGERQAYPHTSFRIRFNAPIDPDTVMDQITMEPQLMDGPIHPYYSRWNHTVSLDFGAAPSTDYVVRIGPGIADPYGNITGQEMTIRFRTAALEPVAWIHVPGRVGTYDATEPAQLVVAHRNTERLDLALYRLGREDTFAAMWDWYDFEPPSTACRRRWSVRVPSTLNEIEYSPVDLVEGGARLEPAVYLIDLEAEGVSYSRWNHRHLLVVSPLNLTLKSEPARTLVWVTDLVGGAPVAGLEVGAYDPEAQRHGTALTDADGLAVLPGSEAIDWGEIVVIAEDPFALASTSWNDGISIWEMGLDYGYAQDHRGHVYTDRPVYRPDQTVFFRGILRAEDDVRYALIDAESVDVTITDAAWELVYEETLLLDDVGTFSGEVVLPEDAALGDYQVRAEVRGGSFGASFEVAAYRPPEFEVVAIAEARETARGETNRATVDVRYFFGGPVADVPIAWRVLSEAYRFEARQFGSYIFSDEDDPWSGWRRWWWTPQPTPVTIREGSGTTDAEGRLLLDLPAELGGLPLDDAGEPPSGSRRLTVEATVSGADGQTLSGRTTIVVHRGDYYVGLAASQAVGRAGDEMPIDVVTVDWAGERLPQRNLEYGIVRREWVNRWVEGVGGGGRWEWETKDAEIATGTLTTSPDAEGVIRFVPDEGGSYKVVVRGRDARERVVQSSLFVWVSGPETVSWRRSNDDRITLISDKTSYVPGETAEILIPSPYEGAQWALITVERGGILQREVLRLESNSTVYRLPIVAAHAPNVYVGVVIVQGKDAAAAGGPAVASTKVGYVALTVEPVERRLSIQVTPSEAEVLPGGEIALDVQVTDRQGGPVAASVSLDVVDRAILSLRPRGEDAAFSAFYVQRGLGVETATGLAISINRLVLEQSAQIDEAKDADRAGADFAGEASAVPMAAVAPDTASGEDAVRERATAAGQLAEGIALREDFQDTAYWRPDLVTGDDGRARVTLTLPDNLTTWVVRAIGVTAATEVGEGGAEFMASKPLLVRPVSPRFLVVGDRVQFAASVSNRTEASRAVTVGIAQVGLSLEGAAEQRIDIPAGDEAKATWWGTTLDVPHVDLAFSAVSGDLSDAARPRLTTGPDGTLPVYRYTAPEIVGTAGQLVGEGLLTEVIAVPPGADDRRGELSVRLDPSLAAAMMDGLTYLEHFEYECTEQVVSRFLPNVLVVRALRLLGIEDSALEENLPRLVAGGLGKLVVQQHADGGWGWWWTSDSSPILTAYVVFALARSREAGFAVDQAMLDAGLRFLERGLISSRELDQPWLANRQAFMIYVLAEAGKTDWASERVGDLFDARGKMSHYACAYLAMTLDRIDPEDGRILTLLSDLANDAILSATGAHWEESGIDRWAMNTDTRSTAIILDALARLDPENSIIPNVVRWLMVARRDGIWETTQETAWSLIALTDWMVVTGELRGAYDYAVWLNGEPLASGDVVPATVRDAIVVREDVAELLTETGNRLSVSRGPGDGRLYYSAHLSVHLPVAEIEPLDRGIVVQREYVPMDCGVTTTCEQIDGASVGDTVQVRLTIIAPHDLYYVVVEDPLPAGGEAIDAGLATSSLLDQDPGLFRESGDDDRTWLSRWWWRWYSRSEMRDEKVVLFADYLPAGTYTYRYTFRATQPGTYHVIPTVAREFYFPEVFGRSDGRVFMVAEGRTE